jgi:hypothetical protein
VEVFRVLLRLICFWRADQDRREIQRDLRTTHEAARTKADHASRDYLLNRDLAALKDEDERKA